MRAYASDEVTPLSQDESEQRHSNCLPAEAGGAAHGVGQHHDEGGKRNVDDAQGFHSRGREVTPLLLVTSDGVTRV